MLRVTFSCIAADLCLPHDSSSRLLDRAIAELLAAGVKPTLPGSLMAACKRAAPIRSGRTVPRAALRFMCNALFRALPLRLASATYDGIASVCRPHSRTMAIVSGLLPESRW